MISLEVGVGAVSEDPTMDRSNVGDSFKEQSDQATMSGTTKELACFLVEMKISLEDLSMKEMLSNCKVTLSKEDRMLTSPKGIL